MVQNRKNVAAELSRQKCPVKMSQENCRQICLRAGFGGNFFAFRERCLPTKNFFQIFQSFFGKFSEKYNFRDFIRKSFQKWIKFWQIRISCKIFSSTLKNTRFWGTKNCSPNLIEAILIDHKKAGSQKRGLADEKLENLHALVALLHGMPNLRRRFKDK